MNRPTPARTALLLLASVAAAGALLGRTARTTAAPSPLDALAFLVGEHAGQGEHSGGFAYAESMTAERELSDSVLVLRSRSRMGDRTVFEDLRVFTYDVLEGAIRCRQFCFGWVTTYDVEVDEETGAVTMAETASEGGKTSRWRYRIEPGAADGGEGEGSGFSYVLETTDRDGTWSVFTRGTLAEK